MIFFCFIKTQHFICRVTSHRCAYFFFEDVRKYKHRKDNLDKARVTLIITEQQHSSSQRGKGIRRERSREGFISGEIIEHEKRRFSTLPANAHDESSYKKKRVQFLRCVPHEVTGCNKKETYTHKRTLVPPRRLWIFKKKHLPKGNELASPACNYALCYSCTGTLVYACEPSCSRALLPRTMCHVLRVTGTSRIHRGETARCHAAAMSTGGCSDVPRRSTKACAGPIDAYAHHAIRRRRPARQPDDRCKATACSTAHKTGSLPCDRRVRFAIVIPSHTDALFAPRLRCKSTETTITVATTTTHANTIKPISRSLSFEGGFVAGPGGDVHD